MTLKVYSIRSNARRDARKFGLDPESVEACDGGWLIGALRQPEIAQPLIITGERARLLNMLRDDWQPMSVLSQHLGWLEHTVRASISGLARSEGVKIERRRVDGVTSYRAVQPS